MWFKKKNKERNETKPVTYVKKITALYEDGTLTEFEDTRSMHYRPDELVWDYVGRSFSVKDKETGFYSIKKVVSVKID